MDNQDALAVVTNGTVIGRADCNWAQRFLLLLSPRSTAMLGFILKVFGISLLIAIAIKYGGPLLPVAASASNALVAICLPALLMAVLLGIRWRRQAL